MTHFAAKILWVREESPTVKTLAFRWDVDVLPGQFVMVWTPGIGEIPMSLSSLGETKTITVKDFGPPSAAIVATKPGQDLYIRGPYGNHFTVVDGNKLVVGAGSGMASLAPLIDRRTYGIVSAREKSEVILTGLFDRNMLLVTTDDGSMGLKGNTIEGLKAFDRDVDMIYVCGPEKMLYAVYNFLKDREVRAEFSLERSMKCGIGICDSCSIDGFQLCRDGPVFPMREIRRMKEFGVSKLTYSGKRVQL